MKNDFRILISSQGENSEPFLSEMIILFNTIKQFGGRLGNSKLVANFTKSVNSDIKEKLNVLDVEVRIVESFESKWPHANKIKNLEFNEDYDVLFVLDSDTVIVRDFSDLINPNYFQASPVHQDPLTLEQWSQLFSYFDLSMPKQRLKTSSSQNTIPYFNSGVLAIPRQYVKNLRKSWSFFINQLDEFYSNFTDIGNHQFFTDQFALTLALVKEEIPLEVFPLEMNFHTNVPIHDSFCPNDVKPFIIHHHHLIGNNQLLKTGYSLPDEAIDKVNSILNKIQL